MADFKSSGSWVLDLLNIPALILFIALLAVVIAAIGDTGFLQGIFPKVMMIFGMLLWAFIYTLLRRLPWFKMTFGVLQIAGGVWSNRFQLVGLSEMK